MALDGPSKAMNVIDSNSLSMMAPENRFTLFGIMLSPKS
jgi:hypothetical protein